MALNILLNLFIKKKRSNPKRTTTPSVREGRHSEGHPQSVQPESFAGGDQAEPIIMWVAWPGRKANKILCRQAILTLGRGENEKTEIESGSKSCGLVRKVIEENQENLCNLPMRFAGEEKEKLGPLIDWRWRRNA